MRPRAARPACATRDPCLIAVVCTFLMVAATFGAMQAGLGLLAVRAFARTRSPAPATMPAVTILKPVYGDEPLLAEAIRSFCVQDYPCFQLLIGAQDANDPALGVARRLQAMFPGCDIGIVVDPRLHGANRKVSNLMNMLGAAKHPVLVISDSDTHVRPDFLVQVVSALASPGAGLVTTVCAGEPACAGTAAQLGVMHLSHSFLPGALLAAAIGRRDCLGGTMALRRETLERAGGLAGLVMHLADDNVLGQRVRQLGLAIKLAATVPAMTVREPSLKAVWQQELRWARTIRALAPVAYGASILQFPLFWALLAVLLSRGGLPECMVFLAAWAVRFGVTRAIDEQLRDLRAGQARPVPAILLPLRDILSAVEIIASFCGNSVVWRGHAMRADGSDITSPRDRSDPIPAEWLPGQSYSQAADGAE